MQQKQDPRKAATDVIRAAAFQVQKAAEDLSPRGQTGVLRNSIHVRQLDEASFLIGTNVVYAPYLEFGTGKYGPMGRPYLILPKKQGGVLAFSGTKGKKGRGTKRQGRR